MDEPERLFGAAPRERDARAAVPVVVDPRRAVVRVLPLEAYLRAARAEADLVLQYLGPSEARLERRAAPQDARRCPRVRLGVPLSFLGCAAEDAVLRAGDYVGNALRVLFVEHEPAQAGVAHAHDLAAYRHHRRVADELARAEPRAVDDDASIHELVQRGDGEPLDVSASVDVAVQQVPE